MTQSAIPAATRSGETAHHVRMGMVVLALAAGFAFVPRVTAGCGKAEATEDAPDFKVSVIANASALANPDQKSLTLSELKGHPVILDFWATWCGPCQMELPIVNNVAKHFKDNGLVVLGMNTDDANGLQLAPVLAKKKSLVFPILIDDDHVGQRYKVDGLPTLVVINKDGKVAAVRSGVTGEGELERLVRQVL